MPSPISRRWCLTLNNYSEEEYHHLITINVGLPDGGPVKYCIVGKETGNSGTPHLQAFVIFHKPRRLTGVKTLLGDRYHIEAARGTSQQARDYCRKDGTFVEFGDFPGNSGTRTDLNDIVKWADDFEQANGYPASAVDFAREQPIAYIRYPRFIECARLRAAPFRLQFGEPRLWQRELATTLDGEADDRTILFYIDEVGNTGKSWFQRWYLTENPETTQVLGVGKRDDLAFMVDESKSVFLFNIPRGQMEFFQFAVLEMIKDRLVTSTKYHSRQKILRENAHVVVFANEYPDMAKLSEDRVVIKHL